jgi:EAL domain-containing protein (putative c-di-GMP-specific phosphodiesterase class I)
VTIKHLARLPRPLATFVQPIVDVSSGGPEVFAVECLTRGPRGSRYEGAVPLFDYVRRCGLEREMDRACIAQALRSASACGRRVTLNVHPSSLTDGFVPWLLEQSRKAGIEPSRIIIEVGEQSPAPNQEAFCRALAALRQHGVGIAVDDVGYGHSNLRAILECRPDFLKIDRYFVDGVDRDPARVAAIQSILAMAHFFGAQVIAEGVERVEEYETLRGLGIRLFQGFLFSRPSAASGDWTQHPVIHRILQHGQSDVQAFIEAGIGFTTEWQQPVDGGHGHEQSAVQRFGF